VQLRTEYDSDFRYDFLLRPIARKRAPTKAFD
jgi:hypothetical protein